MMGLFTQAQIEDMKHCIGMYLPRRPGKPYKRNGRLFYKPWRNYFATGPKCNGVERWLDLEQRGYAARMEGTWTFWLTRNGLDALGITICVQIHDE